MININIKTDGALFKGRGIEIYKQELQTAMTESVLRLENEVVRNTPVFLGFLRNGIVGKIFSPFRGQVGVVGPATVYASVVELGRRPGGKFPPPDAIKRWLMGSIKGKRFVREIKIVFGIKKQSTALNSATYLKSKGIAEQGTKGQFMFRNTEKKLRNSIWKRFEEAAKRANARL